MIKSLTILATSLLAANASPTEVESRIINGNEATPFAYPFVVSLQTNGGHFCGGSLLDSRTVLTAAHCTNLFADSTITVNVHRHDRTKTPAQEGGQAIRITRQTRHPSYSSEDFTSDVAVWKLASPVTVAASYVTLDDGTLASQVDFKAKAIGWGRINPNNNISATKLQQTILPIYDNQKCQTEYGRYFNPQHHVCAGYAKGITSVCKGDSGGPLFAWQDNKFVQIGVSNYVKNDQCLNPNAPSVFARVANYATWIREQQQQA